MHEAFDASGNSMRVQKRDGCYEEVAFDKVLERVRRAAEGLAVNATSISQRVLAQIVDGVKTSELDEITASLAASLVTTHPDYGTLAARIAISNHHKATPSTFAECVEALGAVQDSRGRPSPVVSAGLLRAVRDPHTRDAIQARIDYGRDFLIDYFGFKTLEKGYLLRDGKRRVVERPAHMWMRVSLGLWLGRRCKEEGAAASLSVEDVDAPGEGSLAPQTDEVDDLARAFETYDLMSTKAYTHATPTLFNSGTPRPQLSSCFLAQVGDSIDEIFKTLADCARISKYAGGIGLHAHNVRAKGAMIRGTNGQSNGLVPMLRTYNNVARYVDQCFTGDTLVMVAGGATKRIADIEAGDEVLTSGGTEVVDEAAGKTFVGCGIGGPTPALRTVTGRVEHTYSGKLLHVTFDVAGAQTTVSVTPQHPFLGFATAAATPTELMARVTMGTIAPDYHAIDTLTTGDWVVHPVTPSTPAEAPRWGGVTFARIVEKREETVAGATLYDLEVEGTHDYAIAGAGIAHNGGGKRNGSFAVYLEPWHADVEDFLRLRLNTGSEEERARDLFYALWVPDLFMERVAAGGEWTLFCPSEAPGLSDVVGDEFKALYERYEREGLGRKTVSAQKLWFSVLDAQIETGTPYLCYKDAANKKSNQQNLGVIKSSNLCVAPETLILTDKGHVRIDSVAGQKVKVWNGDAWSDADVVKTGEGQRLLTVALSNGAVLECTPYHKFLVRADYDDVGPLRDAKRVDAADLREGDRLAKHALPLMQGDAAHDTPHPYTHGFFCGDGCRYNNSNLLALYGEKKELLPHLVIKSSSGVEDAQGRLNTVLPVELAAKFHVPLHATLRCRLQWLAGILDSDGTVCRNGDNESLQIGSIVPTFLEDIRLMLQTLGVQSKVTKLHDVTTRMMPNGRGGTAEYVCQPFYRLLISSSALHVLTGLGLECHRLQWTDRKPQRNAEQFVTVVSVVDAGRVDDTYCFTEPLNHAGVFNGILTGQCSEIVEYSDNTETAVCNLASLSLPAFLREAPIADTPHPALARFDLGELRRVTRLAIRSLDRVIDVNFYPTVETRRSNFRHRPVGLGVQGLADVFASLGFAWDGPEAAEVNKRIFATMYFAAVEASVELAGELGAYSTFPGSPASKGQLQPDLWGVDPATVAPELDWAGLRKRMMTTGLRNSLLVAPMPTASTAQVLGNNECFEPFTSNIFTRRTLAGEFIMVNKHLVKTLAARGLWDGTVKDRIIANSGSVQGLREVPEDVQRLFRTAWEMKQRTLIDLAADRGAFVCQSQSLNLFVGDPDYAKLSSMHMYSWRKGLKTGVYYVRTKSAVQAQKFTVDPRTQQDVASAGATTAAAAAAAAATAAANEPPECLMCSA